MNPDLDENIIRPEEFSFVSSDGQLILEWLAVLSSQNINFKLFKEDGEWTITVSEEVYERAQSEITAYESDRGYFSSWLRKAPGKDTFVRMRKSYSTLFVALMLLFFFGLTGPVNWKVKWFKLGSSSTGKFQEGEWWRIFTALTLHSDFTHVCGNVVFMVVFASSICFMLGAGTAWLLIVLAGALGNLSTVFIYGDWPHNAIGASTSVFGALGVLAALRFFEKVYSNPLRQAWLPLLAALALLVFTGGAPGSDIAAHLMGFGWGIVLGICSHFLNLHRLRESTPSQMIAGSLAGFLIFFSWYLAFQ